jgi:hypothetical protein
MHDKQSEAYSELVCVVVLEGREGDTSRKESYIVQQPERKERAPPGRLLPSTNKPNHRATASQKENIIITAF